MRFCSREGVQSIQWKGWERRAVRDDDEAEIGQAV
jgi:hypothetical protein